ncbi:MAG: TonB-dependent receptor plug domain-containing protein [Bacteroidales bacterium]|nr:TonB-dependent receptor plug domain-containing protein [Bacteroidales bacterium]
MKGLIFRLITFLPMFLSWWAPAQETIWTDTLRAAVKTDTRSIVRSINKLESSADVLRGVVSPMGEGDPIRWSQALPGVSTGADGSSAMYVHGGNMGNNLFSLDGVPVYGYSHILGLTTTVPSTVIESTSLSKGGFEGRYGNFTAAHLNIVTSDPAADRVHAEGTLNNFLAGANAEAPLGHGMSFIASARISPIGLEYKAFSQLLPARLAAFQDFRAGVGDFYGKFNWTIDNRNSLSASTLLSLDQYGFTTGEGSRDALGWNNEIAILKYHRIFDRTEMDTQAYVNRYGSMQRQEKNYHGTDNILSLNSSMLEAALSADFSPRQNSSWKMDYGFKARYGRFAMGPAGTRSGKGVTLVSAYIQTTREIPDKLHLQAVMRGNYYYNFADGLNTLRPDASLSFKWNLSKSLALEGSADYVHQFYHTLEGLPLGWSTDVIVSSGRTAPPEYALQGNLGFSLSLGRLSASLGGYYKRMGNLVYYKYAQALFTDAFAGWEHSVDIGRGNSYGGEFLYEYLGKDLYFRTAYTLSKTDREGFATVCDGGKFHARFDRRHILNVLGRWKGVSLAMTLQSGHWENGAPLTYQIHIPGLETEAEYYEGVNNFHMPTVFRLDLGYERSFRSKRAEHTVNLGVCNMTNHFNPFMLYYDAQAEGWKMLALLPIMPNFNWRLRF